MGASPRITDRLPYGSGRGVVGVAGAVSLSLAAAGLRFALDGIFPPGFPYLTFFPAVILSSFLFGARAGALAGLLGGLLAWYYFIPPYRTFALEGGTWLALLFYAAAVGLDVLLILWLQRANSRLRDERERNEALATRSELLFRELQHRVANNLQMVGAVLHHHERDVSDPLARAALSEAGNKLELIGRIQRQLYGSDGSPVALDGFLAQLVDDVMTAGGRPGIRHTVHVTPGIVLAPEVAIPLALILAEGIANAVEHGFGGRTSGCVAVNVAREAGAIALVIADDGEGLPPGFALDAESSLGLRVSRSLARQIGGTLSLCDRPSGSALRLVFPDRGGALS